MSENPAPSATPPSATPPGWYPDGTDSGLLRWWSGVEWTEHTSTPYTGLASARPALPADRPVYSVFIWLIVLLPLPIYLLFFTWQPNFSALSSPSEVANPFALLTPGYFLIIGASWLLYALSAVFAWRDAAWLRRQGVERPFPWPWVFLYSVVYVIGRSVIVYRVARPRGRAPIWVFIAVYLAGLIITFVWTFTLMAGVLGHLPDYGVSPS